MKLKILSLFKSLQYIKCIIFAASKTLPPPIAMIASLSMAFKFSLGEEHLSDKIDMAISKFIKLGYRTKDIAIDENYLKTSEVANKLITIIENE